MNPLIDELCSIIGEEISIIKELYEVSLVIKEIVTRRDLRSLEESNHLKKTKLLTMVSIQKKKDSLISELAISLGLDKDSNVKKILDSKTLEPDLNKRLLEKYNTLECELRKLADINSLVSITLVSSYRLLNNSINIINLNGTADTVYSREVDIKSNRKRLNLNRKV